MTYFQVKCTGRCTPYDILPGGTTTSAFHLAMCHTVPRPVPVTWQYVIRCTATSAFHLEMYHTVHRPVHFTWQCVIRYHDQCLSLGNMSYGTTTSAFHLEMCHNGTMTSTFHMIMRHTVPRPVPFTWQCVIRYHDQRLSPGTV
jgi:hypothetical protein